MTDYYFIPDNNSQIPKYQQLIDSINNAVNQCILNTGDTLPSVNQLCKQSSLSRDTVVKAYNELKRRGIIESIPNKGYYVAAETERVFLFLDTYKAYKEVLYNNFINNLPTNVIVDVHFHHYNIKDFETIVLASIGKYSKYIIMNFDNEDIVPLLEKINPDNLLIIDWTIHIKPGYSFIRQDFGEAVYNSFSEILHLLKKYNEFIFIYPAHTYHPHESVEYFNKFCDDNNIKHDVLYDFKNEDIKAGRAFVVLEDVDLAQILDRAKKMKYKLGQDIGILSYNETPMKRFICEGITVISTNFEEMGRKAAEYITKKETVQITIPTSVKIRESL